MQEIDSKNEITSTCDASSKKGRSKENKTNDTEIHKEDTVIDGEVSKDDMPAPAKSQNKQAFIYLGPNIPGGILFTGSIFKSSPEELKYLEETIEKLPEIKELFVEVQNLPQFKKDLTEQGTEAYRLYQNVELLIREGALKNVI